MSPHSGSIIVIKDKNNKSIISNSYNYVKNDTTFTCLENKTQELTGLLSNAKRIKISQNNKVLKLYEYGSILPLYYYRSATLPEACLNQNHNAFTKVQVFNNLWQNFAVYYPDMQRRLKYSTDIPDGVRNWQAIGNYFRDQLSGHYSKWAL